MKESDLKKQKEYLIKTYLSGGDEKSGTSLGSNSPPTQQAIEAAEKICQQLREEQANNPAWSKAELWGIERDIIPMLRVRIQAAIDEATAELRHQLAKRCGELTKALIDLDKAESRLAQEWTTAPVVRSNGTAWDGILYIVDWNGRKLGSMNHLEAYRVVDAHNKAESRPAQCDHVYSRSMDQPYPRHCLKCGAVEGSRPAQDIEAHKIKAEDTPS